ncbi:MAG: hypothetical protein HN975_03470 [Anaerolineae bacterium]|nr:hypothetical protein [Anaerolineae bacterium]
MKTYSFKVVVKPDGDRWHACCPALQEYGAATWGHTEQEAYRHIHEVVQMVIEEILEDGEMLPEFSGHEVQIFPEPHVAVTV